MTKTTDKSESESTFLDTMLKENAVKMTIEFIKNTNGLLQVDTNDKFIR